MSFKKKLLWGAAPLLLLFACHEGQQQNNRTEDLAMTVEKISPLPVADNTEEYSKIAENNFLTAKENPLSTFSIDVDRAAYSNVRRFIEQGTLPPADAVRLEEMVNYFDYDYQQPKNDDPVAVYTEMSSCPWNNKHRLIHIGLKGKEISTENLPAANLVFLIDVSGSMQDQNKLPLVKASLKLLTDQLRDKDRVAIVTYAGEAGVALESTPGSKKEKIKDAIDKLDAGGSTAGAEGILQAYKIAHENFIGNGGNNRVILATDGDFNVGVSSDDELVSLIEKERKSNIFLTVLGFGMGNYKDSKMQQLADKGNGNHAYIDNMNEARKTLVNEFGSNLFTIAKDVKLQVEFNPAKVNAYRLIGYENRMLAKEDFNNDEKDAGEMGSGHTVTALYEVIPFGVKDGFANVDNLKYQDEPKAKMKTDLTNEIMTVKIRYKTPEGNISKLITQAVKDENKSIENTSANFRFSASVAEFGLLLRNSQFKQNSDYKNVIALAENAKGDDKNGYRAEFINLVKTASSLDKN
jgi:Ca-activated chloride channel family protein